jgi:hypothetical protein
VLEQVEAAAGVATAGRPVLSLAAIKRLNRPDDAAIDEGMGSFGGMFGSLDDDEEEEDKEEEVAATAAPGADISSLLPAYALEVQIPWSRRLLGGTKTIETRAYPLPPQALKQPVLLVESPEGGGLAAHGLGAVSGWAVLLLDDLGCLL